MHVSCIIVTYNNEETIKSAIKSAYENLEGTLDEVIIADNNSTDRTVDILKEASAGHASLKILVNKENIGYRKAVNQLIKLAKNELILVMNPDAALLNNSYERIAEDMNNDSTIGYAFTDEYGYRNVYPFSNLGIPFLFSRPIMRDSSRRIQSPTEVDIPNGAVFMVRRSTYLHVGGYSEALFMYNEEEEISHKLKLGGYKVIFYPVVAFSHKGAHSTNHVSGDTLRNVKICNLEGNIDLFREYYDAGFISKITWYFAYILKALWISGEIGDYKLLINALSVIKARSDEKRIAKKRIFRADAMNIIGAVKFFAWASLFSNSKTRKMGRFQNKVIASLPKNYDRIDG